MFGLNREGKSWADQVGLPESDPADTSCQKTVGYKGRSRVWGTSKVAVHL
jgi:hypothetical protein